MSEIMAIQQLEPGLYRVARPDEIKQISVTVTLRENEHFWRNEQWISEWNPETRERKPKKIVTMHASTYGLRYQAEQIGAHVTSRIVEQDRNFCSADATGSQLYPDGIMEVIRRSKDYDLAAELFKASLKKLPRTKDEGITPSAEQSTALAKMATEETALALVSSLPPSAKAEVMQARLELQGHRLGLCQTKAENQVYRHFVARAGGVLTAQPGFGEMKVTLIRCMLMRDLDIGQVRAATEALFGPGPTPVPTPTVVAPEPEVPPVEDHETLAEEGADQAEGDAAAEGQAEEQPATATVPEPAPAEKPTLSEKAKRVLSESRKLFTRPAVSGGLDMTNNQAWAMWLKERFGILGPGTLATFTDPDCDAILADIAIHAAGELYDWKPASADSPWEDQ